MAELWGREPELARIKSSLGRPGFGYVAGRRRVGKTALLTEAVRRFGGVYHQAVEGTPRQQLLHLSEELGSRWPLLREVVPRSWPEFFSLLSRETPNGLVVFDEFPYWVQGDPTLPSHLQKWIDHQLPRTKATLLVSGSSQSLLHTAILSPEAPLRGRTTVPINLEPLSFRWFCRALRYDESDPASFERYSLVGGVPHYWRLLPRGSAIEQAQALYFAPSAVLAEEPKHWLRDEGIGGTMPKALLDLIGRGVAKPGELAGRLGTVHGNLSRPLAMLLDLGFVQRELPFGESPRSSKRVLYTLADPALSFYYGTCLPSRERWPVLSAIERTALVRRHASRQWESYCRHVHKGSSRYWEGSTELDLVAYQAGSKKLLVAECKWQVLSPAEEAGLLERLRWRFAQTRLAAGHRDAEFRLLTKRDLPRLARLEE